MKRSLRFLSFARHGVRLCDERPSGDWPAARARGKREFSEINSILEKTREDIRARAHGRTRGIMRSLRSMIPQARRPLSRDVFHHKA